MSDSQLLKSFFGLMAYRGMILGPIAALVGWLMIFQVFVSFYMIYSLLYGVFVGVLIGGSCGLVCGTFTVMFFRDPKDKQVYIRAMMTTSGITAFLLGVAIVRATHAFYAAVEVPVLNEFGLLGGILAACGAVYGGREIGNWYIQTQKAVETAKAL